MINIHLNGDLVHCPNIPAIQKRIAERRDAERRCIYGIHEDICAVWQNSVECYTAIKKRDNARGFCRCSLSGCDRCPGHIKRKDDGNKQKLFRINNVTYRQLASTAHYLVKASKLKVLFLTLTFPKFKRNVTEKELNEHFSRFMENLRKNYGCKGYIAVRENGTRFTHRYHYHIVAALPFVPFRRLNTVWINCISDICHNSKNAVQTDRKARFVDNPVRAMRYVCKYFAKSRGQASKTRLVFISNVILQKPKPFYGALESILTGFDSVTARRTSDYTTCFRITEKREFWQFCKNMLYPFFNLIKAPPEFYFYSSN